MKKIRILYGAELALAGALYLYSSHAAALALLLAVGLLPAVSALLLFGIRKQIHLSAEGGQVTGRNAECRITVENRSVFRLTVKAHIEAENRLTQEQSKRILYLPAEPHSTSVQKVCLEEVHCGNIQMTFSKIRICDVLKVAAVPVLPRTGIQAQLTVLPEIFTPSVYAAESKTSRPQTEYAKDCAGYDMSEIFDLKEYRDGDSIRNIHWKMSGKWDKLIIREGSHPTEKSVFLLWHIARPELLAPEDKSALASVYVSAAYALIAEGIEAEAGWYGADESVITAYPLRREEDLIALLPRILSLHPQEETKYYRTEEIFGSRHHIVSISDTADEQLAEWGMNARITQILLSLEPQQNPAESDYAACYYFSREDKEQVLCELEL